MYIQALHLIALAIVFLASASFVTWLVCSSIDRRERQALAEDMTFRVKQRYDAYLELETQVARVIEQFDRREKEFKEKLSRQTRRVRNLQTAFHQRQGVDILGLNESSAADRPEPKSSGLDIFDVEEPKTSGLDIFDVDEPKAAATKSATAEAAPATETTSTTTAVSDGPAPEKKDGAWGLSEGISGWEQKVKTIQAENDAEIERQSKVIAELTECLERLEPLPENLMIQSRELRDWKDKCKVLEQRTEHEIKTLNERNKELESFVQRCDEATEKARTWEQRYQEIEQTTAQEIAQLTERIAELEPLVDMCAEAEERARELTRKCQEIQETKTLENARLMERIGELEPLKETLGERDHELEVFAEKCRRLEDERSSGDEAMKERDRELERVSAQLVQTRDSVKAFEAKCQVLEKSHAVAIHDFSARIRGLESDASKLAPLTAELEERRREVKDWERRYEELEAHGRTEKLRFERRVAELEPLIEEGRMLRDRVIKLENDVRSRQQALDDLVRERTNQDGRLETLRHEHAQLTAKLTGVETALRSTEERHRTLEEQSSNEIANLTNRIQVLNGEIGTLDGRLDERSQQITDLERKLGERSAEINGLSERYEERSREIAGLQESYQDVVRKRDALDAEFKSKQTEVRALDAEIANLRLQLNSTIHSVDGQKTRISELMGTLETSQSEIERAKHKIAERDNYFRSAQQVLNEMRPMLEALEQQLKNKGD